MTSKTHKYHLLGLGGAGMSALAGILLARGYQVTGSDLKESATLASLKAKGAHYYIGHSAEQIGEADIVIRSGAVQDDNPELVAAAKKKLPILSRGEAIRELFKGATMLAVSGSHGKSSTTSMLGQVLTELGLNPTVLVGGYVQAFEGNYRLGRDDLVVIEACEYDKFFLQLQPTYAAVLNLELEHTDQYPTLSAAEQAFRQFVRQTSPSGGIVLCADSPVAVRLGEDSPGHLITYSLHGKATLSARGVEVDEEGSRFQVLKEGRLVASARLPLYGEQMISNALATLGLAELAGADLIEAIAALAKIKPVERRFDMKGEVGGVLLVDDYAHHPSEIAATIKTARTWFKRPVMAIFQPHLYSRTRDLKRDFGRALALADQVIITDVFAAREKPIAGVSGELLAEEVRSSSEAGRVCFVHTPEQAAELAVELLEPGWVALVMGAGDINKLIPELERRLLAPAKA